MTFTTSSENGLAYGRSNYRARLAPLHIGSWIISVFMSYTMTNFANASTMKARCKRLTNTHFFINFNVLLLQSLYGW